MKTLTLLMFFSEACFAISPSTMSKCGTYEVTAKVACENKFCRLLVHPGTKSEFRYEVSEPGMLLLLKGRTIQALIDVLEKKSPYEGTARLVKIMKLETKTLRKNPSVNLKKSAECKK